MDYTNLTQNRGHWWAVLDMGMKHGVPYNEGNLFDLLWNTLAIPEGP